MPTPIKYFNPLISDAYKQVEKVAQDKLVSHLPEYMKESYSSLLTPNEEDIEYLPFLKAADKLSALIKCIEEEKVGNKEFMKAYASIKKSLEDMDLACVKVFMDDFLPSYLLTLDEQD